MPVTDWKREPLTGYPAWHPSHVHVEPLTNRPVQGWDAPVGCATHGVVECGPCYHRDVDGAVYEAPQHADGVRKVHAPIGAGVVEADPVKRPARTFRPFGEGCKANITHPTHKHSLGPWRATRTVTPQPTTVEPTPLEQARAANKALAARLGITLPE